ncbi:Uncharacterised protein [Streptococcus pneumoniae]|nr:Uncharacterised protein [Streptococcus pneumoniae]CWH80780.1 Uncharacterised protein [Streptococcus pneumoniae]
MKKMMTFLKKAKVKAFTLMEMKVTKIIYTFHLITILSAVTWTLFISPLTSTF